MEETKDEPRVMGIGLKGPLTYEELSGQKAPAVRDNAQAITSKASGVLPYKMENVSNISTQRASQAFEMQRRPQQLQDQKLQNQSTDYG